MIKRKLKNIRDKQFLARQLANEPFERMTVSFYRYVGISDLEHFRDELYKQWSAMRVLGRVYVSTEGINAQINVPKSNWEGFVKVLQGHHELKNMPFKIGVTEDGESFGRLTIKMKEKIVADGLAEDEINLQKIGKHISAEAMNEAIKNEDSLVVDMRNHYEYEVGHFESAVCPNTATFREALPEAVKLAEEYKEKEVVLYCTGGIRCEKASAYFKEKGFKNVSQLHGGIIAYAHEIQEKAQKNRYKGRNYVFDGRDAEKISEEIISQCHQCQKPCDIHTNCKNTACHLLFLQCDDCKTSMKNCCSQKCQKYVDSPETFGKVEKGVRIFSKHAKKNLVIPQKI